MHILYTVINTRNHLGLHVFIRAIILYFELYLVHNWGSDLGNLLQGGEAYVIFFAENTHFRGTVDCAPEYQSNQVTN